MSNSSRSLVPPNKHKNQLPIKEIQKKILLFYPSFKKKKSANIHESEQQDSVNQEIETEIKFFLAGKKILLKMLKNLKSRLNSNKIKYTHLARFAKSYFLVPPSLFIEKVHFKKPVACTNK